MLTKFVILILAIIAILELIYILCQRQELASLRNGFVDAHCRLAQMTMNRDRWKSAYERAELHIKDLKRIREAERRKQQITPGE